MLKRKNRVFIMDKTTLFCAEFTVIPPEIRIKFALK